MPSSRRSFNQNMGSLLALPLLRSQGPDIILYNGKIWTVDEAQTRAQAAAISGGRFLAVGSHDDVLRLATGRTRKIDLDLRAVLPGFNDTHSHPVESGVEHLRKVACDKDSIAEIQALLQMAGLRMRWRLAAWEQRKAASHGPSVSSVKTVRNRK